MHRFLPSDGAGSNNFENLPLGPSLLGLYPNSLGHSQALGVIAPKLAGAVHHLYPAANESRAFTFVTLSPQKINPLI